jgi:hypothetical protein
LLPFAPIAGTEYSNHARPKGKADGQDTAFDVSKAEVTLLINAVIRVDRDHPPWINESALRGSESDAVSGPILPILFFIPLEPDGLDHPVTLSPYHRDSQISIWFIDQRMACDYSSSSARARDAAAAFIGGGSSSGASSACMRARRR